MQLRTCVSPDSEFVYGIHQPGYYVRNLRERDYIGILGCMDDGRAVENRKNFPTGAVEAQKADVVIEIPNPFPFRGTTYILKRWADVRAADPTGIALPKPPSVSLLETLQRWFDPNTLDFEKKREIFRDLPEPLELALATTSTDPDDLVMLAESSCEFIRDPETSQINGLAYRTDERGEARPVIRNQELYEAVANNPFLPDDYKEVMVLRPGVQGDSEIVGEWLTEDGGSHVFEYLRRNSYIPWGHFAANMAHDTVRYRVRALSSADMTGMRHLYYQRTYIRLAEELGLEIPPSRQILKAEELEGLRIRIGATLRQKVRDGGLKFNSTLWGWNFGFDYAPSRYRLHASHQQIHQQYALVPSAVSIGNDRGEEREALAAYACGDLIAEFIQNFRKQTGKPFFDTYIQAIRRNCRVDERTDRESSLVIWEDDNVMVFVPKAQTSQWELQLMVLDRMGNILETDTPTRASLDRGILIALSVLEAMGTRMVTCIEYAKRFDHPDADQRLLYAFLPRLPESPGAFSEAQLRWINGHYPEDFAAACRSRLTKILDGLY